MFKMLSMSNQQFEHPSERQISTVHMEILVPSTPHKSDKEGAPTG